MSITVTCICGTKQQIEDAQAGQTVCCGVCGAVLPVHRFDDAPEQEWTTAEPYEGETVFNSPDPPPDKKNAESPRAEPDSGKNRGGQAVNADDAAKTVVSSSDSQETCFFQEPVSVDSLAVSHAADSHDSSFILQDDRQTTADFGPTSPDRLARHERNGAGETQVSPIHISLETEYVPPRAGSGTHPSSGRDSKTGEIDLSRRITPTATPMEGLPEVSSTANYGINRIIRPHAKGGMGLIQIAYDQFLKREVALKELRPEVIGDDTVVQRFIGEAEITAQLEHPGIVPIHHLGLDGNGNPYYTMKLIKGITLQDAIKAYHANPNPVELTRLVRRLVSVCQTISFAHDNGVIHRDLKPANIMLSEHGETIVMDWGLAKSYRAVLRIDSLSTRVDDSHPGIPAELDSVDLTVLGAVVGTPAFMSPEQASPGGANVGPVSDVYSLGAILFVLLTGQPAYTGRTTQDVLEKVRRGPPQKPSQVKKTVPSGLEAICMKAMARSIPDRYQDARELMQDLCRWLDKEPISAVPTTPIQRVRYKLRKHNLLAQWLIGLGTGLLLILFSVVGYYSLNAHKITVADREILLGDPDLTEHPFIRRQLFHAPKGTVLQAGDKTLRLHDPPSLMLELGAGEQASILFLPANQETTWDLRQRKELQLNLLEQAEGITGVAGMTVRLGWGPHYFEYKIQPETLKEAKPGWVSLDIPLAGSARFPRTEVNLPDLGEIGWIEVHFKCESKTLLYLDGVKFQPSLIEVSK